MTGTAGGHGSVPDLRMRATVDESSRLELLENERRLCLNAVDFHESSEALVYVYIETQEVLIGSLKLYASY
jgi:hypothetical protein